MAVKFWHGKKVFLTGHTGFKGAWLTSWLSNLGADILGYSLPAESGSVFAAFNLETLCSGHIESDLDNLEALRTSINEFNPDVVIHMAAQSLVRRSYRQPIETIRANVNGTAHVLEACRNIDSIRAALFVTTDKCYANNESGRAFRENDVLGGQDVYSASKAASEIIIEAYKKSFFSDKDIRICSARAGNVIGGGDHCMDRLVPDAVKAFSKKNSLLVRAPKSLRPWQHVADPLIGYLKLAQSMFENEKPLSPCYNFGPSSAAIVTVEDLITRFAKLWPGGDWHVESKDDTMREAKMLTLNSRLAGKELGWKSSFSLEEALQFTRDGYKVLEDGNKKLFLSHVQQVFQSSPLLEIL